jgi:hypothetical protein
VFLKFIIINNYQVFYRHHIASRKLGLIKYLPDSRFIAYMRCANNLRHYFPRYLLRFCNQTSILALMLGVICISIGYTDDHLIQTPYNNVVFKTCTMTVNCYDC